ncbi:MAG: LamG domain-containing protein [Deltaproteobacteria bacterium]|nr:LamG domain-containing protein [Deltaproteobacteria bacterium]
MKLSQKKMTLTSPWICLGQLLMLGAILTMGCYHIEDELDTYSYTRDNDNVAGETDSHTDIDNVVDSETYEDTGTGADTADAHVNRCLALDGDEDYVRIRQDEGLAVSGEWTMEAWVWYRNDGSLLHPVLRGADESTSISSYFMYCEYDALDGGEKPMVGFGYTSSSFEALLDTERLPTEEWIHMAFVHDGESHRFYLDGQLVREIISSLDARPVADDVIIGAILHPNKTGYLNGYADDIRLSSVVRYDDDFVPKIGLELDDDTIVLWNFDEIYSDDFTMDASGTFVSSFYGDAHIVERKWDME